MSEIQIQVSLERAWTTFGIDVSASFLLFKNPDDLNAIFSYELKEPF